MKRKPAWNFEVQIMTSYHSLNWLHAWRWLPKCTFERAVAFGGGTGAELLLVFACASRHARRSSDTVTSGAYIEFSAIAANFSVA
jgi:hypothetical protein